MKRPATLAPLGLMLLLVVSSSGCRDSPATPPEPSPDDEMPTTAVTHFAEGLEVFMEHPYAVVGGETEFNVHLTVLRTVHRSARAGCGWWRPDPLARWPRPSSLPHGAPASSVPPWRSLGAWY